MSQQPEQPDKLQQTGFALRQLGCGLMQGGCAITFLLVLGFVIWALIFGGGSKP